VQLRNVLGNREAQAETIPPVECGRPLVETLENVRKRCELDALTGVPHEQLGVSLVPARPNPSINKAQPKFKKVMKEAFSKPEIIKVTCDVHSWMLGWIAGLPHPYFGVTDMRGVTRIDGVPAGTHTVEVWHEQLGRRRKDGLRVRPTEAVLRAGDARALRDFSSPSYRPLTSRRYKKPDSNEAGRVLAWSKRRTS
jgi:hypothetical protein